MDDEATGILSVYPYYSDVDVLRQQIVIPLRQKLSVGQINIYVI